MGNGQGIAKNEEQAAAWFRKAADQGYAPGQYFMGNMYRFGTGVKQSLADAMSWYRKAAEQAFPRAWTSLGVMYDKGEGVLIDPVESYKWVDRLLQAGASSLTNERVSCWLSPSPRPWRITRRWWRPTRSCW